MVNDEPVIVLRNSFDDSTAVKCHIRDCNGRMVVEIKDNAVQVYDESYYIERSELQLRVVNAISGRRICAIRSPGRLSGGLIDLSFITHTQDGSPIVFHPNRTIIPSIVNNTEFYGILLQNTDATDGCITYSDEGSGRVTFTNVLFRGGQVGIAINCPSLSKKYCVFVFVRT
jgi:hypothetical protein